MVRFSLRTHINTRSEKYKSRRKFVKKGVWFS